MTELEFQALAQQGYNRIPLLLELFADLETPLSLYLKLAHQPNSFLLESVLGGERFGRYSFVGLPASTLVRATEDGAEVVRHGEVVERHVGDPLAFVEAFRQRFRVAPRVGLPRFSGGLAGYFAYDLARPVSTPAGRSARPDPIGIPDLLLLVTEELAIIDTVRGKLYLMVHADPSEAEAYEKAQQRLRGLRALLRMPLDIPFARGNYETATERPFSREAYLAAAEQAAHRVDAGALRQLHLSQLLCKRFTDSPLTLYRALRSIQPSPYMYLYNFGAFHLVGASPEILVRQERTPDGERVTVRTLAGRRSRGITPAEDAHQESALRADPAVQAQHRNLIELACQDLTSIAEPGSVEVSETMVLERHAHGMHLVSTIEGRPAPGVGPLEVLRATFPAGALTGAPRAAAMALIEELEPTRRGLFGGGCGYLSFQGELDLAMASRTGIIRDGGLYVRGGASLSAGTSPEQAWQESDSEARALLRAAELVQSGLE